jgi:type VI secretion system secreted protein VgrG
MTLTQDTREIGVSTPLGKDVLLLERFVVHESLGRLYSVDLEMVSTDLRIDPLKLLGENATVRVDRAGGKRYFNGFFASFEFKGTNKYVDASGEIWLATYRARLVPWAWFLTQTSNCRIFQDKSCTDIVKETFGDLGFSGFEENLSDKYPSRDYVVQYRETYFDFVSRLMEDAGIYFFFEHEDGKHKMILCDGPGSHKGFVGAQADELIFRGEGGIATAPLASSVMTFEATRAINTGVYATRDYNFLTPSNTLESKAINKQEHAFDSLERFDYPGGYDATGEGDRLASVRIGELQWPGEVFTGNSPSPSIAAGSLFKLSDHQVGDYCAEYLCVEAEHTGTTTPYRPGAAPHTGPVFETRFKAIRSTVTYRSERRTPRPEVRGPQTAFVVGREGREVDPDEHGRVKVKFHWDRYAQAKESDSCWLRVAQDFAGKRWGALFTPRIGQEVIVSFLDGDPDRPLITGRVYNDSNRPPYNPKSLPTVSTIKTNSSKGGGGFNEIRFDDKKGEEQLFLHAQKQMDVRVLENSYRTVMGEEHLVVEKDEFRHLKKTSNLKVDSHLRIKVGGQRSASIGASDAMKVGESFSVEAGENVTFKCDGDLAGDAAGAVHLVAGGAAVIEATAGITLVCGGNAVVIDATGITIKGSQVVLDGNMTKINSGPGASPVSPEAPKDAFDADEADPGEVAKLKAEQQKIGKGKYGSVKAGQYKKQESGQEEPVKQPVEFQLLDADGDPVKNEKVTAHIPGEDAPRNLTTNGDGIVRIEDLDGGTSVRFELPDRADQHWEDVRSEELNGKPADKNPGGASSGGGHQKKS